MSSTNINYASNSGSIQNNISRGGRGSGSGSGNNGKRKSRLKTTTSSSSGGSSGDGTNSTKKKKKTSSTKKKIIRSPRSAWEISNIPSSSASTVCVRCAETHTYCIFDTDSQKCTACKIDGCECQPLNTSWKHNNKNSKLGQRGRCVCCSKSSKECIYVDTKDKYNQMLATEV